MPVRSTDFRSALLRSFFTHFAVIAVFALIAAVSRPAFAQPLPATTTTLTVTSDGSAVTSVSIGTVVTLTATVMSGTTPVTPGQVKFCDTSVSYCTDIFLVSQSQLTTSGTAVYKFRPGPGSHSYNAVFLGTKTYAGSSSGASSINVTGPPFPSVTGISASSIGNNNTLTAQVSGGAPSTESLPPTGTVSFVDMFNIVRATAPLGPATQELGFAFHGTVSPTTVNAVVADFNLDGIPDILIDDIGANSLITNQGNGDGTFTPGASEFYGVGGIVTVGFANGLAVADFNSDGIPDVVMVDGWFTGPWILLGSGNGSFQSAPGSGPSGSISVGSGNQYVAVADFNGDGIPDMVIGSSGGAYSFTDVLSLQVLLGNGDGSFRSGSTLQYNTNFTNYFAPAPVPAAGDFNGDGIPDLAVANLNSGTVDIYLGNGDGTFKAPSTLKTGSGPNAIAVADFNKDGKLDLAVTNSNSNTVSIFLGNGDGTFTAPAQIPATGNDPSAITVGDFNGDGIPDLAVYNFGPYGPSYVTILLGNGDGTFTPSASQGPATTPNSAHVLGLGSGWPWIASGDLNGDGLTDLVVSDNMAYLTQYGWTATAQTANLTLKGTGTDRIKASYSGDANFNPSVSETVGVTEVQLAAITSPAPASLLSGSAVTFQWTAGSAVTAYKLSVGTTGPGSSNIYASPVLTSTSAAVSGLPTNGAIVYVTLGSEINGVWDSEYYTYTAAAPAAAPVLTAPAPGSKLSGSKATFTWSAATGATDYALHVGTTWPGSANIYASPISTATTATATGLPTDGSILYVTLLYKVSGVWNLVDYTYTAAGSTAPPVLTTPDPGSKLTGSTATFTWTPGTGVTEYQLGIGSYGPGYFNIYGSGALTTTSVTATGLPTDGRTLYVTLKYLINGVWNSVYYTYTATGMAVSPVLITPTPGTHLSDSTTTFTWTPGSGVTQYRLNISTYGPGYFNVYGSGTITATSVTVSGLPTNGPNLYVALYYQIDGVWNYTFYTYPGP